jgi:3-isopropylmalate/(R)-2-methylmalate dehydratase large subunit
MARTSPLTLFEKIWNDHVIADFGDNTYLIHIDRNFLHEMSGALSFKGIDEAGRTVRHPELTFATIDHVVDTEPGRGVETKIPGGSEFIRALRNGTKKHGIRLFDLDDPFQGIVHVIAPELGIALPGNTIVCGDSHTCTIGGLGMLAWGIGSTDGEHVLATQTLVQTRPKTMLITFDGSLGEGVTAKDMILYLIGKIGADGGNGYAVEYAGSVVRRLSIEGRLTICNMSIEFSARTGFVSPDDKAIEYLYERPFAPKGQMWEKAVAYWKALPSDPGARFDREINIDCTDIQPQVTWGTSPEHVVAVDGFVPDPADSSRTDARLSMERALSYMGLAPGTQMENVKIGAAFIGSCTNGRLSDLQVAADILKGHKVSEGVRAICSPGSSQVKRSAEAEGLNKIFLEAGFEWREAGCSLCMSGGAGGESFDYQQRVVTTTNRNFEGRQGPHVRSHLASPAIVAASAVTGHITDPRKLGK